MPPITPISEFLHSVNSAETFKELLQLESHAWNSNAVPLKGEREELQLSGETWIPVDERRIQKQLVAPVESSSVEGGHADAAFKTNAKSSASHANAANNCVETLAPAS